MKRDPISLHISIPSITLPPPHAVVRWIIWALASLRAPGWPQPELYQVPAGVQQIYFSPSTPSIFLNSRQSMSYLAVFSRKRGSAPTWVQPGHETNKLVAQHHRRPFIYCLWIRLSFGVQSLGIVWNWPNDKKGERKVFSSCYSWSMATGQVWSRRSSIIDVEAGPQGGSESVELMLWLAPGGND